MKNRMRWWSAVPLLMLVFSCQNDPAGVAPVENRKLAGQQALAEKVHLTVDKTNFAAADTIQVRLHNGSAEPVYLEGCSQLLLATKIDSGWSESPLWVCVWEGLAVKTLADSSYRLAWPAAYLHTGMFRFVAPVYYGCAEGRPVSEARCLLTEKIYSAEFTVTE